MRKDKFLREIGIEPAESTSRNPLEQPRLLGEDEFIRRARWDGLKAYQSAREETGAVMEEIGGWRGRLMRERRVCTEYNRRK